MIVVGMRRRGDAVVCCRVLEITVEGTGRAERFEIRRPSSSGRVPFGRRSAVCMYVAIVGLADGWVLLFGREVGQVDSCRASSKGRLGLKCN